MGADDSEGQARELRGRKFKQDVIVQGWNGHTLKGRLVLCAFHNGAGVRGAIVLMRRRRVFRIGVGAAGYGFKPRGDLHQ